MKYKHEDGTPFTKKEFLQKLKTDKEFNDEFGSKGIDQIQNLINTLKTNPDDRRMIVSAWNVAEIEDAVLPPCHYGFQIYTRELSLFERNDIASKMYMRPNEVGHNAFDEFGVPKRAISLRWHQRSCDTPLGIPFNIASYGLLLSILGEMVNMIPEELSCSLGDTHIYLNQVEGVKEQLTRESYDLPTLRINTEFWPTKSGECGIGELTDNVDNLIKNMQIEDFQIENYQSHSTIKMPLSN